MLFIFLERNPMCGIIGFVSTASFGFTAADRKVFESLLWINTLRGEDSTGIFGVSKHGNVDYLKEVGNPDKLMSSTEYKKFYSNIFSSYRILVGHNRKATQGMISDKNAHPFVKDDTILVHNGTLMDWKSLTEEECSVDSEAILNSITTIGAKETFKKIKGAFTLVWYNATKKALYLARNKERPLFIADTDKGWIFASEKGMLEWILSREKVTIKEMIECTPDTLYTISLEKTNTINNEPIKTYTPITTTSGTNIVPLIPKKKLVSSKYFASDFILGKKILFHNFEVITNGKGKKENKKTVLKGDWILDENISVVSILTKAQFTKIASELVKSDDEELLQGTITSIHQKQGKITLFTKDVKIGEVCTDFLGNEIIEDEFMLTLEQCDECKKKLSFEELSHGIFTFQDSSNYELYCPNCVGALQ